MQTYKIKMIEDCGQFKKGSIYDAAERKDDYVIFHHTGWYAVSKDVVQKVGENVNYMKKSDLESPEHMFFHDIELDGKLLCDCELIYKGENDNSRLYILRREHGFKAHAVEYVSCSYGLNKINQWDNKNLVVMTLFQVTAYSDGVRHLHFNCNNAETDGYLYYPKMADLIAMLQKVKDLEIEICRTT